MTVNGIEINLDVTPYKISKNYDRDNICYETVQFCFSSKRYLIKFERQLNMNRIAVADKFYKRYGIVLDCTLLADLMLYKSIEKRGYQIVINGVVYKCQENLILNGNKVQAQE